VEEEEENQSDIETPRMDVSGLQLEPA
jgi:hypothetical protein